jgi:hypothetical protein
MIRPACSRCFACAALLAACAPGPGTTQDVRSPSHDYPPPARTTADGEPLGADRKAVTDTAGQPTAPPTPPATKAQ